MLTRLLAFIFILNLPSAFAQGEIQYALIREVRGIESVPQQMQERLKRLSMQVVLKQPGYQILMSPDDIPSSSTVSIFAVESDLSKENDRYQIETKLLDLKNKKLVRKASIKNIRESDLLRLFQASIEAIFKPAKETIPEEVESEPKEKVTKVPPPLGPKLNVANHNAIDFKARINAMKGQVDSQIKKLAEQKKTAELEDENNDQKKNDPNVPPPSPSTIANTSSKELDPEAKKERNSYKGKSKYDMMVGWDKRTINSDYLISTKTAAEMLTLKVASHNSTRFFSERLNWSYELAVSKLVSGKIDLPILYQLGLFASWVDNWGFFSLGVFRDKSFISNLDTPGEGVQVSNLEADWFLTKTQVNLPFLKDTKFHLAYGIPLMVTSEMSQLDQWSGSLLRAGIIPPRLVANWDLNIIIERIELTNQGVVPFTSEDSRMALFIQRSF